VTATARCGVAGRGGSVPIALSALLGSERPCRCGRRGPNLSLAIYGPTAASTAVQSYRYRTGSVPLSHAYSIQLYAPRSIADQPIIGPERSRKGYSAAALGYSILSSPWPPNLTPPPPPSRIDPARMSMRADDFCRLNSGSAPKMSIFRSATIFAV
jgi:hypothetical protein